MKPIIQTKQLTKVYRNGEHTLTALNSIDLEIREGEIVALTGSSGSGKTTLMHLLGCLDFPTSGQLYLDGEEISACSARKLPEIRNKKIGFVFQSFCLLEDLNCVENAILPQLYGGISDRVARSKALQLLEVVGLGGRAHHKPNQLSGGQRQRLAIARSLVMDPPILLADEPTGNLDSENADRIIDLFFQINRERGTTIVLVTHEKGIAQRAQRCITIRDGKIASDEKVSL